MSFKRLNLLVLALIIVIIGAIFFIRIYNKKFVKRDILVTKKAEEIPKLPSFNERVNQLLDQLKDKGIIEIHEGDIRKVIFKKREIKDIIEREIKSYDNKISFHISKKEIIFYKGDEKLSIPYAVFTEEEKPNLVIVIDDIGNSLELGEKVLKFKNVTLSIIPQLKYSLYFAKKGKEMKKDILVHVPMEPHSIDKYNNGETKFLRTEMSNEDIKTLGRFYLESIPYAIGANNHMGSKFTEDPEKMRVFLEDIKERKMFFLDSRTSSNSIANNVAEKLNITSFSRDVFLDHVIDEEAISKQLDKAIEIAKEKGYAIVIGHPHKETLNVLEKRYEEIRKKVNIVPISSLLKMKRG